jgi:hypothetical protein
MVGRGEGVEKGRVGSVAYAGGKGAAQGWRKGRGHAWVSASEQSRGGGRRARPIFRPAALARRRAEKERAAAAGAHQGAAAAGGGHKPKPQCLT